jgi:hypothetical protein
MSAAYEIGAAYTDKKTPGARAVRVVATDCNDALAKTLKFLTAAGYTDIVLRSVQLIWPLDVVS